MLKTITFFSRTRSEDTATSIIILIMYAIKVESIDAINIIIKFTYSNFLLLFNIFFMLISIPLALRRGTISNERFSKPPHHEIITSRGYTTKHGRRSCKFFLVLDSILISVSPAFSSTNKWLYKTVH